MDGISGGCLQKGEFAVKKLLWATLAVAMLLGATSPGSAQDTPAGGANPVVTVSFAGYDALRKDLGTIGKVVDQDLVGQLDMGLQLAGISQNKNIPGLDGTRPWGAVLFLGAGGPPSGYVFIPVIELKDLMAVVPNPAGGPFTPDAEGVYEVRMPIPFLPPVYVGAKGKWAILSNSRVGITAAAEDPSAMLGDLAKKYLLSVKTTVKNVPAELRKLAVDKLEAGAASAMERQPGEDEDMYNARINVAKQSLQKMRQAIDEMDNLLLGLAVDSSTNGAYLDFEVTAKPGTKSAQEFASMKEAKTNFSGLLLPNAAVTATMSSTLSDANVVQTKAALTELRKSTIKELDNNADLTKEQRQLAQQLLTDAMDVLQKTVEGKNVDGGMALVLEPGAPTMVVAVKVAEGAKLEKVLKQIVAEAGKEQPDIANLIKLNKETVSGVNLHVATVPVPDAEAQAVLGNTVDIIVGTGEDSLYVAAGKNSLAIIKTVIEKSKADPGKSVPPLQITVSGTPIAKFAAATIPSEDEKKVAEAIATVLAQSGGKDHLLVTAKGIPDGMNVRISIEEGLLKAVPAAVPTAGKAPAKKAKTAKTKKTVEPDAPF
jgi:hypothetical protein